MSRQVTFQIPDANDWILSVQPVRPTHKRAILPVGGITPLSTVDWPERISTVVFLQGCPWRCAYCHNRELQPLGPGAGKSWPETLDFLAARMRFIDGVVFSGGEPLLHSQLANAIADVRSMGLGTALHTGGLNPSRLEQWLDRTLLDWVALDIKAPRALYPLITGDPLAAVRAYRSLEVLVGAGVAYELRTTVDPRVLTRDDLVELARDVSAAGGRHLVLQQYRNPANPTAAPNPDLPLEELSDHLHAHLPSVRIRGAA